MSVSLEKGHKVSLTKAAKDIGCTLSDVSIGLGWDCNTHGGMNYDLDAWALAVENNKLKMNNFASFFNMRDSSGYMQHMGDNLTGAGDGDDEVIQIQLDKLPKSYSRIYIGVSIYQAKNRKQSFSDIENTFVRIYDNKTGLEICRYSTDKFTGELKDSRSMLFGILERVSNGWEFYAEGKGYTFDRIMEATTILNDYVLDKNKDTMKNGGKKAMAVNLSKGGKVSLAKVAADAGISGGLTNIVVGLGWDTNKYDGGGDFDLDASAFCCGESGKVTCDDDFVFYNNKVRPGIEHMGDNRTGEGDGDDEVINIDLTAIPQNISEVNFTVTIFGADERHQNFGMVENSYIRVVDQTTGTELIRYDLTEDFSVETALVVAKLYRHNGEWKFNAIGSGFAGGLEALCKNFGVNV